MTIEEHKRLLGKLLLNHKHFYDRQNEGIVYLGFPNNEYNFQSKDEKYQFVYLLCLLITFDLKVYESFSEYYLLLKKKLKIPKFEYGLTNTFIYPEEIFNHFKIGFSFSEFRKSYKIYSEYIEHALLILDVGFNLLKLNKLIVEDEDLNKGLWGGNYCKFLMHEEHL